MIRMMLLKLRSQVLPLCCFIYCLLGRSWSDQSGDVTVSLQPGQELRGVQETGTSDSKFYAFYGIPYARPPTGSLRFQPPQPADNWTSVKDAVAKSAICLQDTQEDLTSVRSEDCLYLNVFTPDVNSSLPVIVWIHGGGFMTGSAYNDGDGGTLAPHGIVSVTINYRLGALGFLSTDDAVMPGNYGLLDQVLALKWVQKYIHSFGGDPDQVTIGGESAGAYSMSMLILSPLAKGLFERVVSESGYALSIGSTARRPELGYSKDSTVKCAARVGCNQSTTSDILSCLQKVDSNVLFQATRDAIIGPKIETAFGFLPDHPVNILRSGRYNKVDTLQGANSGEFFWTVTDPENDGVTLQQFTGTIEGLVAGSVNPAEITQLVVQVYAGNETDPLKLRAILLNAVADLQFGSSNIYELNTFVSSAGLTTKHFLYEFDYLYSGDTSPAWQGSPHAAERRYVFFPDVRFKYPTQNDRDVGKTVQSMWVNFIKYGDPTPSNVASAKSLVSWSAFTKTSPNLLVIDANSTLTTYPRPFVLPLYEKILEIVERNGPLVG